MKEIKINVSNNKDIYNTFPFYMLRNQNLVAKIERLRLFSSIRDSMMFIIQSYKF